MCGGTLRVRTREGDKSPALTLDKVETDHENEQQSRQSKGQAVKGSRMRQVRSSASSLAAPNLGHCCVCSRHPVTSRERCPSIERESTYGSAFCAVLRQRRSSNKCLCIADISCTVQGRGTWARASELV